MRIREKALIQISYIVLVLESTGLQFPRFETRKKLGRVNVRKDFWDRFQGQEKNGQWLTGASPGSIDPTNICGAYFGSSSFLISKLANECKCEKNVNLRVIWS